MGGVGSRMRALLRGRYKELRLSDLRGRWVLLDFWATWCGPCLAVHPKIVALGERYADLGLVTVGVLHRDWPGPALEYVAADLEGSYRSVIDEDVRIANLYGIYGIPQLFLIDPAGTIASRSNLDDFIALIEAQPAPRWP